MTEPADREGLVPANKVREYQALDDALATIGRLEDVIEELHKREESQDRIRNLLTVERDEARADLATIARTCDNLLFAIDQGSFNPADKWLRHDFGYLRDVAKGGKP